VPRSDILAANAWSLVTDRLLKDDEEVTNGTVTVSAPQSQTNQYQLLLAIDLDVEDRTRRKSRKILRTEEANISRLQGGGQWIWRGFPLGETPPRGAIARLLRRDEVVDKRTWVYVFDTQA
jgi:hypothetical protein